MGLRLRMKPAIPQQLASAVLVSFPDDGHVRNNHFGLFNLAEDRRHQVGTARSPLRVLIQMKIITSRLVDVLGLLQSIDAHF